ncbi:hypothetical protein ABIA38_007172 [Embleya sp. AB8]
MLPSQDSAPISPSGPAWLPVRPPAVGPLRARHPLDGVVVARDGPVRPPGLAWRNRIDLSMRAASPVGALGYAVDRWGNSRFEARWVDRVVAAGVDVAAGGARVDEPHVAHLGWVREVLDGGGGLQLPIGLLGPDVAIESSRLLVRGVGVVGCVPVHQEGRGPGLLLDPRYAITVVCLLARDPGLRSVEWAGVAEHTPGERYLRHDYRYPCGAFGPLPRLRRSSVPAPRVPGSGVSLHRAAEPRWYGTPVGLEPGQTLVVDARTLWACGAGEQPWMALIVRLIAPGAVIARPECAPPIVRVSGAFSYWNSPGRHLHLREARRRSARELGP